MKIVIHIGLPKAASTTLQQLLQNAGNKLATQGAFVPSAGTRKEHRTPNGQIDGHNLLPLLTLSPVKLIAYCDHIIRQAGNAGCQTIILSSENLSHPLNISELPKFVQVINKHFVRAKNVEVVYVLIDRSDENWLRSFYNERVMDGRSFENREFVEFASDMSRQGVSATNIRNECRAVIGEALIVTERIDGSVRSALNEFASICGVTLNDIEIPHRRASPTPEIVEQTRLENRSQTSNPWVHLLTRPDQFARMVLSRLPRQLSQLLRRAYRRSLALFSAKW